jgi:hypothetical protein
MKDIKDLKKRAGQLSQSELSSMEFMLQELKNMIEKPQITEDGYRRLVNVSKEFENLKEIYSFRIIKLIKQNHMI